MRVLVCGDRYWTDWQRIFDRLSQLDRSTVLIHGACRGADLLAANVGTALGFEILAFPAQWSLYGKAAGPIRNLEMIVKGKPDLVIAFHSDIEHSRGTKNMIRQTKIAGIPYEVIDNEQQTAS